MSRPSVLFFSILLCLLAFPSVSPAPLIFRPGEGWVYEKPGQTTKWTSTRAKDQLEVGQKAFAEKDYSLALKAARRVVKIWPLSDYAPEAQYLIGRCYEAKKNDEKAFKHYQQLIEKYPQSTNYDDVLQRQYEIAGRFLAGQRFKLWGIIPTLPSMDKTADMLDQIVKSGPYSKVAPHAQMDIGAAREKQKDYPKAVRAYEIAADRYSDQPAVAADALFKAGMAYHSQAKEAEYDQNTAIQAIAAFNDFATLYPEDSRVNDTQTLTGAMKFEQARGSFEIGRFYEKRKRFRGAEIYYNEAYANDQSSSLGALARLKVAEMKKHQEEK